MSPPTRRMLESRPSLAAIERAVSRDELRLQMLLRLTPLNPATLNYLSGASGVRFSGFLIACLALAPNLFVEVYFGQVGRHAARLAAANGRAMHLRDLVMVAGLAVCIAVMLRVSSIARRAVMKAVAEAAAAKAGPGV